MTITYASTNFDYNTWFFDGPNQHNLLTAGNDLLSVEFLHPDGSYNLRDDFEVSRRIRFHGGTWNTRGAQVNTGLVFVRDNQPINDQFIKTLNTNGSDIYATEWSSRLTYGSFTVNGAHRILASLFEGSPQQLDGPPFLFDEIHLQERSDANFFLVEDYNFE